MTNIYNITNRARLKLYSFCTKDKSRILELGGGVSLVGKYVQKIVPNKRFKIRN